jgi:proline iminopeptidase
MSPLSRRGLRVQLTVILIVACSAEPADDAAPSSEEGYVETSTGIQLFYHVVGSGGDTIVALHGGPGFDFGYLAPDLEPLSRSHTVVYYDQRGAGRSTLVSDSASLTIDRHVDDVEEVRRHFGLDRMILLGHSWGATLGARYALAHPERVSKLVLASPSPIRRVPYRDQLMATVMGWMDSTTRAEVVRRDLARDTASDLPTACRAFWALFIRGYFSDPLDTATIARMRGDFCTAPPDAMLNSFVAGPLTSQSLGDWDWRRDFGTVEVPVLVIAGAEDIFPPASAREWAAAFPNATLVEIDDAGHYPQVEEPDRFFDSLTSFLAAR